MELLIVFLHWYMNSVLFINYEACPDVTNLDWSVTGIY